MTTNKLYTTTQRIHKLLADLGLPAVESNFWIDEDGGLEDAMLNRFADGIAQFTAGKFYEEPDYSDKTYYITERACRKILVEAFGGVKTYEEAESSVEIKPGVRWALYTNDKEDDTQPDFKADQLSNKFFTTQGSTPCLWDSKGGELACLKILAKELEKLKVK